MSDPKIIYFFRQTTFPQDKVAELLESILFSPIMEDYIDSIMQKTGQMNGCLSLGYIQKRSNKLAKITIDNEFTKGAENVDYSYMTHYEIKKARQVVSASPPPTEETIFYDPNPSVCRSAFIYGDCFHVSYHGFSNNANNALVLKKFWKLAMASLGVK